MCLDSLLATIRFDDQGLVPVVVQDADGGTVLLLAYMNRDALKATLRTRRAHYWSRSRQRLWRKGETSGCEQHVQDLAINCEDNSLLLTVRQQGAVACHTGHISCFYRRATEGGWMEIAHEDL